MLAHGPKLGKRKVSTLVGRVNNGVGQCIENPNADKKNLRVGVKGEICSKGKKCLS